MLVCCHYLTIDFCTIIILLVEILVSSINLLQFLLVRLLMSKNIEKQKDNAILMKEGLKEINKKWFENKVFFIVSLVLGPLTFVFGFLVDYFTSWQSWITTIFFVVAAGFFVVILSYLFNLLWLVIIREKK